MEAEITDVKRSALERAFYDWWADNGEALSNGHCGQVLDLLLRLNAAAAKACISSQVTPRDL